MKWDLSISPPDARSMSKNVFGRFGNFHKGVINDFGLLECDAMSMIKWFLPF